jgi:hypothetical protein
LNFLNDFRDEVTWLDEPRPDYAAQEAEMKARRVQTQEIRKQADAVHREREEAKRAEPPAAKDPSASVERRQLLALEEERLARQEAAHQAAIEALKQQENEDALGRAAAEEEERLQLQAEENARVAEEEEEERYAAMVRRQQQEEEASLRLVQALQMEAFTCESCQELMPVGDRFRLAACSCDVDKHYCIECMRGWIQSEIGSQALNLLLPDYCPLERGMGFEGGVHASERDIFSAFGLGVHTTWFGLDPHESTFELKYQSGGAVEDE